MFLILAYCTDERKQLTYLFMHMLKDISWSKMIHHSSAGGQKYEIGHHSWNVIFIAKIQQPQVFNMPVV